ncbi:MAG: GDSL-type esterase/lipase family protein [Caulobacteraceae bacterium]
MKHLARALIAAVGLFLASGANAAELHWATSWGASPQAPNASLGAAFAYPSFHDQTLRQVVRISGGGRRVRIRFTNEFGTAPLAIGGARLALAAPGGAVQPGSDHVLTFAGKPSAVVAPGRAADQRPGRPGAAGPVEAVDQPLPARPGRGLHLPRHGRRERLDHGPATPPAAPVPPADAKPLAVRALISAVEVASDSPVATIVAFGDSITDGVGLHARRRLPLARPAGRERLVKRGGPAVYVSTRGSAATACSTTGFGVSALARFDRDVLSTPGLAYVILFEGVNDIGISFAPRSDAGPLAAFMKAYAGAPVTAEDIVAGYRQIVARAHARGVKGLRRHHHPLRGRGHLRGRRREGAPGGQRLHPHRGRLRRRARFRRGVARPGPSGPDPRWPAHGRPPARQRRRLQGAGGVRRPQPVQVAAGPAHRGAPSPRLTA